MQLVEASQTGVDPVAAFPARADLFVNLVWSELAARYKSTVLGLLWFIVNPLLMMAILIIVFSRVIRLDIPHYPLFVLTALLPWTFFQMGINNASSSLSRSSGLVKRVRIPREFVPLAAVAASLVHFLVSLALLFLAIAISGVELSWRMAALPLAIILQTAFLSGAALLTSSLNVFYRDVEHLLGPVVQALFYLTPTFYPISYVPHRWLLLYLMNPMAGIVQTYRTILFGGTAQSAIALAMALVTSVAMLAAGVATFRKLEPWFDDYL
ncbi:MAG TPA: ABC transporter permease [Candidatus Binataceae bacterium]|nr:ABC transporter permease [Candidatus Binataceae bacterium]